MATGTPHMYNRAPEHLTNGDIAYLSDTIKAMILTAYTPSAAHNTIADVKAAGTEASSTTSGYTTRGQALTSKTISASGAVTTFDSADASWTTPNPGSLAGTFVVFYKDTGTDSTSYVIAYNDLGSSQVASNGGPWSAATPTGIATITATV